MATYVIQTEVYYKASTSNLCVVKAHAHYCGLVRGLCVGECRRP
jgi:hypothetical protein